MRFARIMLFYYVEPSIHTNTDDGVEKVVEAAILTSNVPIEIDAENSVVGNRNSWNF